MQRLSDLPSQLFTHIHEEVEAICIIDLKFDHTAPKELDASLEYTAARQKMQNIFVAKLICICEPWNLWNSHISMQIFE